MMKETSRKLAPTFKSGETKKVDRTTDFPSLAGAGPGAVAERSANVGTPAGFTLIERLVAHDVYSTVPLETARAPGPGAVVGEPEMPYLDPHEDLRMIRAAFPFLPVLPYPTIVRSVFLDHTNNPTRAYEFPVPSQSTLMVITANSLFYLCADGNAEIPSAANSPANGDNTSRSIAIPPGFFPWIFYVRGSRSFSVIAPNPTTGDVVVTAMFYDTDQWLERPAHRRASPFVDRT